MKKLQCDACNGFSIKKVANLVFECQDCGKKFTKNQLQEMFNSSIEENVSLNPQINDEHDVEETIEQNKKNQEKSDTSNSRKKSGLHFSKFHIMEEKTENIFVVASMVLICVLVFIFFGWSEIFSFLSSPLVWKGQDSLEMHYLKTVEDTHYDKYDINLIVENNTKKPIDDYTFVLNIVGEEIEVTSFSAEVSNAYDSSISAFSHTVLEIPVYAEVGGGTIGSRKISQVALDKLLENQTLDSLDISYRIIELSSNGEEIVKNTGTIKNIIIVVVSLIFGIFGFFGGIKIAPIRILFKYLSIFAMILLIALIILFFIAKITSSPEFKAEYEKSRQEQENLKRKKAAIEYKNAAQAKANSSNARTAAYAQERMDKAMADMISGDSASSNAYKAAAHTKSVATASGNHKLASQAQAQMDKAMADMLEDK